IPMCSSFAYRSPSRRPYSNVKSMVLVAQFGATAVRGIRQEEKTQNAGATSLESKPWITPPLPHNEMLARTLLSFQLLINNPISQSNDCSNQSANSECPNSRMLLGAHKSHSRAPRRQHRLRAGMNSPA